MYTYIYIYTLFNGDMIFETYFGEHVEIEFSMVIISNADELETFLW